MSVTPKPPTRQPCVTVKAKTPERYDQFGQKRAGVGTFYVHVNFDTAGRAVGVAISTPGKHTDTAIDDLLQCIAEAFREALSQAAPAKNS